MQYVKKNVCTNGPLKPRESYKNSWCSQDEDTLSTHISSMGSSTIFVSRGFLVGNNSFLCSQHLSREIGSSPAIPNYLPAYNYRKISNLLVSSAISKKDCFRPSSEKISLRDKYLPRALIVRFGEWASYSSQLATTLLSLFKRRLLSLEKKWFVKCKPSQAWTGPYINFYQALFSCLQVMAYRKPSGYLAPAPSG